MKRFRLFRLLTATGSIPIECAAQWELRLRRRVISALALLIQISAFSATALCAQTPIDFYEQYVRTSKDFRPVKQDEGFLLKAFPSWTYMPRSFSVGGVPAPAKSGHSSGEEASAMPAKPPPRYMNLLRSIVIPSPLDFVHSIPRPQGARHSITKSSSQPPALLEADAAYSFP